MINNKNMHTLSESDVKKINSSYIRGVDKWSRMYAGIASRLERYENDIIYLKIENTEKNFSSNYETAFQRVASWINFNKELSQAKGFVAAFYTKKFTGFAFSPFSDLKHEVEIKEVFEKIKSYREEKSELVNIFSGLLKPNKAK